MGILFQIVALCTPFHEANICSLSALLIAGLTALLISVLHRKNLYQAALYMDSFGFQERIVTAYEHLDEEGEMVELQRKIAEGKNVIMEGRDIGSVVFPNADINNL